MENGGWCSLVKNLILNRLRFEDLRNYQQKKLITVCVDVSKSNEVSMFVRVSAVDVFNDQEDDGAIDESTNLDDTAEL